MLKKNNKSGVLPLQSAYKGLGEQFEAEMRHERRL